MTAKVKHIRIEKYDIEAFKKEQKPYAQILNEVIQRFPMNHANEFLLWCFLESLPETWEPNKTHITSYFDISDRTYERYMGWLNAVGLIEYRQKRDKGGTFGKWELIVLSGTKFNPEAVSNRSAKIDGTVIHRMKKAEVIHILDADRCAKNGGTVETSTTPASTGVSQNSPFRQKTVERSDDAHINTTKISTKERKKTNNPVSVFSDTESVKTHLNHVIAKRKVFVEDDIIDQIVFYVGTERNYDAVVKKLNIALKLVREGKWNIPQNYNGISSQSIRKKEEKEQAEKRAQYQHEAKVYRAVTQAVRTGSPHRLADMLKQYRDDLHANEGTMPTKTIPPGNQARG